VSRIGANETVLPSLLDRLIDDDASGVGGGAVSRDGSRLNTLRAGVRRDLENLLNTRLAQQPPVDKYPELARSVVNYGLPDFSSVVLGASEERDAFRTRVQQTIERYEPRFRQVRVEIVPAGTEGDRTLHLKITAILMVEPDPVPLRYESQVHATDRFVRLEEISDG